MSKLHKTQHTDPPPEGEEGPKDTKGIWWIKSIFGKQAFGKGSDIDKINVIYM